jgi:hypothetical protein
MADRVLTIPYASFGFIYPLVFLFIKPPPITPLFLIAPAIWAALAVMEKMWFPTHPLVFLCLSALNTAGFLMVLFKHADKDYLWFVAWFSSVCIFTVHLYFKIIQPDAARKTEWERVFMFAVPVIFGVYAAKVYPTIKTQYGGGAPVPIALHFTKKLPVFDSENVSVSLIDETEQGYYVIRGEDKAVFVSRGLVEEVEFLRSQPH